MIANEHKIKDNFSGRILFIDLMRAYAILMMIQGHVVDAFIDPIYRNPENWIFYLWDHMRGVTAPVFFFSAGAIFSYLLLHKNLPLRDNQRFYKGINRIFILLIIGYLLKFNPQMLINLKDFSFYTYKHSFAVDALHCIAIGLGLIITSYIFHKVTKAPVWIYYLLFAFTAFYLYPVAINAQWMEILPLPLVSYFTKEYGSNFPIIPWAGFVMWGALLGYILSVKVKWASYTIFSSIATLLGIILHYYSGTMLYYMFQITNSENFNYLLHHNFLYYHLGSILIVMGVTSFIANFVKIPAIILTIGKNTLLIYVLHIFIIYGTSYNIGLYHFFGKSMGPYQVVVAAILMLVFFVMIVYLREKMEPVIRHKFSEYFPEKSL